MKKLLVLFVTIGALIGLSACNTTSASEGEYYVSVDINPSIEFIVDEEDIVLSFELLNEDAEIIAADIDFVGMNVEDAMALFIEKATEAGYIDVTSDENAVLITVLGEEEDDNVGELRNRLRTRAERDFANRNIMASVFTEDFTAADLVAEANELGVSPGKLKMIKAAQSVDETLLTEDAIDMPVKDIMAIIREHHALARQEMTQTRINERIQLREQLMEQNREALEEHIRANENLTEEQIEAILEAIQERTQTQSQRWDQLKEAWQDRMNNQNQQTDDQEDDNTDTEENPS
jgi:hypothetical protein